MRPPFMQSTQAQECGGRLARGLTWATAVAASTASLGLALAPAGLPTDASLARGALGGGDTDHPATLDALRAEAQAVGGPAAVHVVHVVHGASAPAHP